MKISVVLPEPYSPTYGGALATWTHEVYRLLSLDVKVVSKPAADCYDTPEVKFCQSNILAESLYRGIQNRSMKGLLNSSKSWLRNSYGRRAGRICSKLKPNIIHIHNSPQFVLSIKQYNPKSFIILHMNNDHLLTCSDHELKRIFIKTDCIAFCSEYIRQNVFRRMPSLPKGKTFLIANGASKAFYLSTTRNFVDDPVLLFVGRLVPDKGLHILLESLDDIFNRYPKAGLRVVGGTTFGSHEQSEYLKQLKLQASKWKDRVVFVGPIAHDKIPEQFAQADVFICPSIWNDPLPLVNAEAMASGLPIVAFAKGGIPEIVGDAGILVEETTPQALADGIDQVLKNPNLYHTLSQRGLRRSQEQFNWHTIAKNWLSELENFHKR